MPRNTSHADSHEVGHRSQCWASAAQARLQEAIAEEARAQRGGGVLFPGGDGREEAMARRSKTIPRSRPAQNFYIGDGGTKRPGDPGVEQLRKATDTRSKRPNPAGGNQKLAGGKRNKNGKDEGE